MEMIGEMKSKAKNEINGKIVYQNQQDFIISIFTIEQIFQFTRFTKRFIVGFDENEMPIYNDHIQRYVEDARVNKITDFLINDPEAIFPTNIILHIPKEIINEQITDGNNITLKLDNKIVEGLSSESGHTYITIIDGQHRIRGIEKAIELLNNEITIRMQNMRLSSNQEQEEKLKFQIGRLKDLKKIQIVVSFFIDKTLEYQAMIFSTVNRTQKRVSADLVSSLFGLNTGDTPQKTGLEVVLRLNGHPKSPFFKRIKLYGGNYKKNESPPLTQAGMVRSIVNLICEGPRESELDRYRKRKKLLKSNPNSTRFLPFRKFYALDRDEEISDIMFYFFQAIREIFKDKDGKSYWDFEEENKLNNIFQSNVGYSSLMKIMIDIMKDSETMNFKSDIVFSNHLNKARHLKINDINRYANNNRGKKRLYLDMSLAIFPPENNLDKRVLQLKNLDKED